MMLCFDMNSQFPKSMFRHEISAAFNTSKNYTAGNECVDMHIPNCAL